MTEIFLNLLNMSISAGWLILAVLMARLLLKKAPKWITVALWGMVAIRLICPVSIESVLSLIPSAQTVSPDIMVQQNPGVHTGIDALNSVINPVIDSAFAPTPGASVNPLQVWVPIFTATWLLGIGIMALYAAISYLQLKRKVHNATLLQENIYLSENIPAPFVLGVLRPKIYLPSETAEAQRHHIIAHESAHIHRFDHLWKPLGFALLALHWFNPLMWLGYVLLCRDIELACDEKVIKALDHDARADYSQALLSCSISRRTISACPLAFGEVGVKDRIKSVLHYKKPALWIIIAALLLGATVGICFLTDPMGDTDGPTLDPNDPQLQALREEYPEYFGLDASAGLDVYVWQLSPGSYYFGLLPHSEHSDSWINTDLMTLKSMSAPEARIVLNSYGLPWEQVHIVPWQNPLSSYIPENWITKPEETDEQRQERYERYTDRIRMMLEGMTKYANSGGILDEAVFDIDGDGEDEICRLRTGPTSGLFTFIIAAENAMTHEVEYCSVFTSPWLDLSFQRGADGVIRVHGTTQGSASIDSRTILCDISVEYDYIILTDHLGETIFFEWPLSR